MVPLAAKPLQLQLLCLTPLPCSVQGCLPENSVLGSTFQIVLCCLMGLEAAVGTAGCWDLPTRVWGNTTDLQGQLGFSLRGLGNGLRACVVTRALLIDGESFCFQQRKNVCEAQDSAQGENPTPHHCTPLLFHQKYPIFLINLVFFCMYLHRISILSNHKCTSLLLEPCWSLPVPPTIPWLSKKLRSY